MLEESISEPYVIVYRNDSITQFYEGFVNYGSIKSRISKHYDWMDIALLLEVISLLLIYHIIRWFVLRT